MAGSEVDGGTRSAAVLSQADPKAGALRRGTTALAKPAPSVQLVLSELPKEVAAALSAFDLDGDGTINLGELQSGADAGTRAVSRHHFYKKLFMILFGIWLAQLGSTFGVVFGVVNYAKESVVSAASAQMLTRDASQVVQTAAAMMQMPLSSALPDEAFLELHRIGLMSPTGATMHLSVLGFVRLPGLSDQIVIVTHIGRVVLTGTELSYFDDVQAALFQAAGFTTHGATRRLLQVRALFGIFNAVKAVNDIGTTAPTAVAPPTLPDAFVMFARRLTPCVPLTPAAGAAVPLWTGNYSGGDLLGPRAAGVDLCDLLRIDPGQLVSTYDAAGNLDERFLPMSYTMFRLGDSLLRVEYEHPAIPGQMLVEVLDARDADAPLQFKYQVASGDRGIALLPEAAGAQPALVGPLSFYNATNVTRADLVSEALSAPFDYLGNTTLGGEDVRIWALHLNNGTFHAYWYDTVADRTVRRIAFGDFGVLDIVSITQLEGGEDEHAHLFMAPIPGVTDMGDGEGPSGAPMPPQVLLDPFVPYQRAFAKLSANTTGAPPAPAPPPPPPVPAAGRRRALLAAEQADAARRRRLAAIKDAGRAVVQAAPATAPGAVVPIREAVHTPRGYTTAPALQLVEAVVAASLGGNASGVQLGRRSLLQTTGGCALTNKCPIKSSFFGGQNYANQVLVVAVPGCPLGMVIGPLSKPPCFIEMSAAVQPLNLGIPIPLEIVGTLAVQLCADVSSFDRLLSNLAVVAGIPGLQKPSVLELFSWNVASVGVVFVNTVQELSCSVDNGGRIWLENGDTDKQLLAAFTSTSPGMLSRFGVNTARDRCNCLRNTGQRTGIGFIIGGPDIPGFSLWPLAWLFPPFASFAPFLGVTKITQSTEWIWYPYFCGMTRNDISITYTFVLDLVYFKEEIVFFNPSFNFLNSMPAWDHTNVGPVGREVPGFVDATQPFIDAAVEAMRYVYNKLSIADINWEAVAALTNDFRNIASQFYEQNGANLGANTNVALSRIFRPSRTFEYGCFASYWTGGSCLQRAPRFKLFGRQRGGQCILYDPYQLHCGSTVRCVANCR